MDTLIDWDQSISLWVNGLHTPFADVIFYWLSNKFIWIPAYAVAAYFLWRRYGLRDTLILLGFTGLIILIADQTASSLLKPMVGRLRPCYDPEIGDLVYVVHHKPGGHFGFVSSHAANFFALATWLSFLFAGGWRLNILFFGIATLVGISRIYLGVHYLGDILGGAVVGILSALLVIFLLKKIRGRLRMGQIP